MKAKKLAKQISAGLLLIMMSLSGYGQSQPLLAQYYQNRYLANASMAGIEDGQVINLAYRGQLNNIAGSPENQLITGSFRVKDKVGLGFQLSNATAGLLGSFGAKASYAYHLPLSGPNQSLHMGLSAGIQKDRASQSDVNGTATDPLIAQYNDRGIYFQGDLGLGYVNNKLSLQLSLSNLGNLISNQVKQAGIPTYYGAISYMLGKTSGVTVEPMLSVMGVQSGNTLVGVGARAGLIGDKLQLTGYYHSNSNLTAAIGYKISDNLLFLGGYNVSGQQVQGYTNGSYELGINLDLNKK